MKFNSETIKKYTPFIVVGGVLGVASLLMNKGEGSPLPQTSTSGEAVANIMSDKVQGLQQMLKENQFENSQNLKTQKQDFESKLKEQENLLNEQKTEAQINLLEQKNLFQQMIDNLKNNVKTETVYVYESPSYNYEPPQNDSSSYMVNPLLVDEAVVYKNTYNKVAQALESGNKQDVLNARKAVEDMKNFGVDMIAPDVSAYGEFSKQLDTVTRW